MIAIPRVFVITGTPGTGKTTVSRLLSTKLNVHHIELTEYCKEKGFVIEEDEERDTSVVDLDTLSEAVKYEIEDKEGTIILDGHFAHELLEPEMVELVFVLRKKPWLLKTELENRMYHSEKVWENLEAEIVGVITGESMEKYSKLVEIDTSEKTPEDTTAEIIDIIKKGENPKFTPIDWVAYPETLRLLLSRPCTLL